MKKLDRYELSEDMYDLLKQAESVATVVNDASEHTDLDTTVNNHAQVLFQNVYLSHVVQGLDVFNSNKVSYADHICDQLEIRFGNLKTEPVLGALKILDVRCWLTAEEKLYIFGNDEVSLVMKHFSKVLSGIRALIAML